MYTITFSIEGGDDHKVAAALGANILEVAREAGISIDAPCGGQGTCGKCRIKLLEGEVEGGRNHRKPEEYEEGWRLACQSTVCADAHFMVPSEAASFAHDIQTADLSSQEELSRYNHEVENIFNAGIARGVSQTGYGVAIDIGTTTVTAALLDLATGEIHGKASAGNDQIRYGADVINRIISQGKPGGVEALRTAIRENTIIPLLHDLCAQAGIEGTQINRCVIAGNTTMEHLFLGANGDSIRLEPYEPEFLERHGDTGASTGLPIAPDASVIFAPNVGSYVGGDITAGVLATLLWNSEEMSFFIDLGTNGEMVYGNADFMLTCACSAGPAFEGGDISCGMRATKGAIQKLTIDDETMEPTYETVGGLAPVGLCGSGIIDTVAELFRTGIISARGKFSREGKRIRPLEGGGCEYVLAFEGENDAKRDVTINETDLDNFIRAKGAIFSAFRTMLNSVGATPDDLSRVMIAGGIGSGINMANAMEIGMLPKMPLEKYHYIGNSSLTGACAMLVSDEATEKVFELGRSMTYLELSTEPGYMDEFVAACFIPHTDASLFA